MITELIIAKNDYKINYNKTKKVFIEKIYKKIYHNLIVI